MWLENDIEMTKFRYKYYMRLIVCLLCVTM